MRNDIGISTIVDARAAELCALSDRVWETPELNYQEYRSSAEHAEMLERQEFRVSRQVAGLPTALMGEAGEGGPIVAILGEFDALPGLSQQAGVAEPRPLVASGNGHGCGHNLLGAASLLAATAVKDFLAAHGMPGRVRYYGCPAEEGGSAKGFMVRAGVFDDVDVAISWNPSAFTGVNRAFSLACVEMEFHFSGRSAHAAASPHLGRSALDAVELMNVGVNYLREHIPSTARIHYALIDGGGIAPNVVQAKAVVRHLIRAQNITELLALVERVKKVAQGAALMTETEVRWSQLSGDANLVGNAALEQAMQENLLGLGAPPFDDHDRAFAEEIRATLRKEDIVAAYGRFGLEPRLDEPLSKEVYPLGSGVDSLVGSTDVGTVSWVVPTVQCRVATYAVGTPGHSWQLVAQGRAPAAHKGMVHAAKAMAATACDVLTDAGLLARARSEHAAFRAEQAFTNPIPDDVEPPLDMSRAAEAAR